jgi:hypothetical protein
VFYKSFIEESIEHLGFGRVLCVDSYTIVYLCGGSNHYMFLVLIREPNQDLIVRIKHLPSCDFID